MSLYVLEDYIKEDYVQSGISINWATSVINIPKDDTVLVQSTPTEIRELNLNTFRLRLKDLEDSDSGMSYQKTHNHNTTVLVSGVELARVIEILEPYTITFEDGPWAVNLVGANSNVADRVNVNQVSVRSSNSAGLIQLNSLEIQHSSFNNGVTLDAVNGTDSSEYPYGTPRYPCKTIANSYNIRLERGFNRVYLKSDLTLSGIPDGILNNLTVVGIVGHQANTLTLDNVLVSGCTAENLVVTGTVKEGSTASLTHCKVVNLRDATVYGANCSLFGGYYENAELSDCTVEGDIELAEGSMFSGTNIVFNGDFSTINCKNLVNTISLDIKSGYVKIENMIPGGLAEFNISGGELELGDTITGGDFYAEGYGTLFGDPEALGMNVKANHLLALETIPGPIWSENLEASFSMKDLMKLLGAVNTGKTSIIDNGDNTATVTFKGLDGATSRVIATMVGSERATVNTNTV